MAKLITDGLNSTNFTKKLGAWSAGAIAKRDELQAFIVFAVFNAQENDNSFGLLDRVMLAAEETKSFPNQDICDYIKKVVSGIVWQRDKKTFKKRNSKAKVEYNIGYLESETWFEYAKATKPAKEMDLQQMMVTFAKRVRKALDEGTLKDGQQDDAAALVSLMANQFIK